MPVFSHKKFSTPLTLHLLSLGIAQDQIKDTLKFIDMVSYTVRRAHEEKHSGQYSNYSFIDKIPAASIHSGAISEIFSRKSYVEILKTLKNAGLLVCDELCRKGDKTFHYGLSVAGQNLLRDNNRAYLKYILNDLAEKKRIEENYRKKKVRRAKVISEIGVINYYYDVIESIDFNQDIIQSLLDRFPADKSNSNYRNICQIVEKQWDALTVEEKTGRIFCPLSFISAEIRKNLVVKGKPFALSIDVRACHMTLLARYVAEQLAPKMDLKEEVAKWEKIFCAEEHPKKYFADVLGLKENEVKEMMNSVINGGKRAKGIKKWFFWIQEEFPGIYGQWIRTDLKKTGNNISRIYEQKMLRTDDVIALKAECGVELIDAHDALFIYAADKVSAEAFKDRFIALARAKLGLNIQFGTNEETNYKPESDRKKLSKRAQKCNNPEIDAEYIRFCAINNLAA